MTIKEIFALVGYDCHRALDEIDFDYATSVAQQAQSLMAQHRVPPTPDNFAVWFKYALGTSAQLNMAMNVLIGNKRKFDPATNRDLYRAYVGGQAAERAIDLGVSEQLSTLMVSAQQYLATAIDDNRTQMRALGERVRRGVERSESAKADRKPGARALQGHQPRNGAGGQFRRSFERARQDSRLAGAGGGTLEDRHAHRPCQPPRAR